MEEIKFQWDVPDDEILPLLYKKYFLNKPVTAKSCSERSHHRYGSSHPRESVPIDLFKNPYNDSYYRMCLHCRTHYSEKRDRTPKPNEYGIYKCFRCSFMRTTDYCEHCMLQSIEKAKESKRSLHLVMWERILEVGHCCELCKKSFKKKDDGTPGFITVTGSINTIGLTQDNVEYRNLDFDHLTKEEQLERFGEYRGSKKGGVATLGSYESKKWESRKCMLTCIFCHRLKTIERLGVLLPKRPLAKEKIDYVNMKKCEIGACQICGFKVDPSNLSYYEWDHIDPSTKLDIISTIAKGHNAKYTMIYLIDELGKCRLVCVYCHRIHTGKQHRERFKFNRIEKLAEFRRVMALYESADSAESAKRGRSVEETDEIQRPMKR